MDHSRSGQKFKLVPITRSCTGLAQSKDGGLQVFDVKIARVVRNHGHFSGPGTNVLVGACCLGEWSVNILLCRPAGNVRMSGKGGFNIHTSLLTPWIPEEPMYSGATNDDGNSFP